MFNSAKSFKLDCALHDFFHLNDAEIKHKFLMAYVTHTQRCVCTFLVFLELKFYLTLLFFHRDKHFGDLG